MDLIRRRVRRLLVAGLLVGGLAGLAPAAANSATAPPPCDHRVLILAAMPLELNPLVAKTVLSGAVHVNDRTFYTGRLEGTDVVLALTGIGPVNATETATTAFEHFRCRFAAAVFSGVAGSPQFIGDVMIPRRWTLDNGRSFVGTDAPMYAVARAMGSRSAPKLAQDLPLGDAACLCGGVDAPTPVHLAHAPEVHVGGDGQTTDPFGGHAAPCVWGGGDVAGCEPCVMTGDLARDTATFAGKVPGAPALATGLFAPSAKTTPTMVAQDEETAAVDTVAHRYDVPFLGIRAVSDGRGDPLHLPGFPAQFFVYRQLAGNNAAAVTRAFLRAWRAAGRPT